jgi:hypothetical protein
MTIASYITDNVTASAHPERCDRCPVCPTNNLRVYLAAKGEEIARRVMCTGAVLDKEVNSYPALSGVQAKVPSYSVEMNIAVKPVSKSILTVEDSLIEVENPHDAYLPCDVLVGTLIETGDVERSPIMDYYKTAKKLTIKNSK